MIKNLFLLLATFFALALSSCGGTSDMSTFYSFRAKSSSWSVADCINTEKKNLVIPSTYQGLPVDEIDPAAFKDCKNLETIVVPDSVITIGKYAFLGCTSLTSITIPNSVTSIGSSAFYSCIFLTSITISNSVTSIASNTFSECISLTSITIPNSVTSIGNDAFWDCRSLTSITIPNSVTSIGYAFNYCTSLTSITIPNSVTSISSSAFYGCSSLKNVFYYGTYSEWLALKSNLDLSIVYFYSDTAPTEAGNYWRYVDGVPQIW